MHIEFELEQDIYDNLYKESLQEGVPVKELIVNLLDKYTGKLASDDDLLIMSFDLDSEDFNDNSEFA